MIGNNGLQPIAGTKDFKPGARRAQTSWSASLPIQNEMAIPVHVPASNVEITRDEANFGVKVQADAVGYALEVCMEALFLTSRRASKDFLQCTTEDQVRRITNIDSAVARFHSAPFSTSRQHDRQ